MRRKLGEGGIKIGSEDRFSFTYSMKKTEKRNTYIF